MDRVNNLLYVCSPYRGDTKRNKEYARELTRLALDNDFCPVTVHLYLTEALDDDVPEERAKGMDAGIEILDNCKYILIGGRYGISEGMKREIKRALDTGKIILTPGEPGTVTADVNISILHKYTAGVKDTTVVNRVAKIADEMGRTVIVDPIPGPGAGNYADQPTLATMAPGA